MAAPEHPALVPLAQLTAQHIGGIEPGTDATRVRELLGVPDALEADGVVMEATGTTFETWEYPSRGLSVTVERVRADDAWVAWVTATAPWAGVMPCGLHIGMSEADALLVLGDEGRLIDVDEWEALSVRLEGGHVVEISYSQMGE